MIVKVLGLIDFVAGVLIILSLMGITPAFGWFIAAFLLIKSIIFLKEVTSIIDLLAVIFLVLALYGVNTPFTWIFALWLMQKGFFSIIA